MTFDDWAIEYFGKDVDFPEACRDAWNCAIVTRTGAEEMVMAEREACAKVCEAEAEKWEGDGIPEPMSRICADAIRTRSNVEVSGPAKAD